MSATSQPAKVKALNCPNCGAALVLHAMQHTISIVCERCLSILDAKDPNLQVLQRFSERERIQPLIPLGSRGKFHNDIYEVVGFQVRTIMVEGIPYSWAEYLLFNPYKGFRYLTEYQGHWNDVAVLRSLPEVSTWGKQPVAKHLGVRYKHFQTATAETTFVLGEFPWQVRVGDKATVMDFVAPPRILSCERTEEETTWSLGEYIPGTRVWEIFKLDKRPPQPVGVFANQPSPFKGSVQGMWLNCLLLFAALLVLALIASIFCAQERVFERRYTFSPRGIGEPSFLTETFELKGRPSGVEVTIDTNLSNNWAYFHLALINADNGEAYDFGREVSYYFGRDSDGSWTEGSRRDSVVIPTVPAGRYYLRVEPEMDPNATGVDYTLTVRRDVPAMSFFGIAAVLLLIPPAFVTFRAISFEQKRWRESDYAGSDGDD
ncbi:MAG: DUF4178 domain-containing protein [Rhodospirillales bacterium]